MRVKKTVSCDASYLNNPINDIGRFSFTSKYISMPIDTLASDLYPF